MSLLTLLVQSLSKNNIIPFTNIFIPDSKTYELRVIQEIEIESFSATVYNSLNSLLYQIGEFSFFFFNIIILIITVKLCDLAFSKISIDSSKYAKFFVIYNPYTLLGLVGPNKETILSFVCVAFCAIFFSKWKILKYVGIIIVIFIPLFIRPVVSIVLVCALFSTYFMSKNIKTKTIFFLGLILYFILNSNSTIRNLLLDIQGNSSELESFQGSRLFEVALVLRSFSENALLQIPAFFAKVFMITFMPVLRPLSISNFPVPILDLGYNYLAYLYLPINIGILYYLFKVKENIEINEILLMIVLVGIFTTANNSNITFRYLFPYGAIAFALFGALKHNIRHTIEKLSFVIIVIVVIMNIYYSKPFEIESYSTDVPVFMDWF